MSFIDKALEQAHKALDKHGPKVQTGLEKAKVEAAKAAQKHAPKLQQGVEKVAAKADAKTGGKHRDKIEVAKAKVSQGLNTAATRAETAAPQAPGFPDTGTQAPVPDNGFGDGGAAHRGGFTN